MTFLRAAGIAALLLGNAAQAQTVLPDGCEDRDLSGAAFRACAATTYAEADDDLNEVYRLAITRAKAFDGDAATEGTAGPLTLEEALRQAQRDWIVYRDSHCDALAVTYGKGTGGPPAGTLCRAELTLARAQLLREMMADY